jgi:hypothetical protein
MIYGNSQMKQNHNSSLNLINDSFFKVNRIKTQDQNDNSRLIPCSFEYFLNANPCVKKKKLRNYLLPSMSSITNESTFANSRQTNMQNLKLSHHNNNDKTNSINHHPYFPSLPGAKISSLKAKFDYYTFSRSTSTKSIKDPRSVIKKISPNEMNLKSLYQVELNLREKINNSINRFTVKNTFNNANNKINHKSASLQIDNNTFNALMGVQLNKIHLYRDCVPSVVALSKFTEICKTTCFPKLISDKELMYTIYTDNISSVKSQMDKKIKKNKS